MNHLIRKLHVKTIRKILKLPKVQQFIASFFPKAITLSESIYIRYKDTESNHLKILCNRKKSSLDIGALWGGYTLLLNKLSNKVIVFEPNKSKYHHINKIFRNVSSVDIKNVAISNTNGILKYRVPINSPGNATVEQLNELTEFADIQEYMVPSITIDSLKLTNVGFIKIDIEGHEPFAIEGMINLINSERPILLIEIEERHNPTSLELITEMIANLSYNVYFIDGGTLKDIAKYKFEIYQNSENRNTNSYINNFIFIPDNLVEQVLSDFSG